MADIFISYASEDRDRVKPLVAALEQRGWDVWWDRELVAGRDFDDKIEEALEAARCVVVVWSEQSVKSRWVRAEATEGLDREVLVPVIIDDVRPPLAFRIAQTPQLIGWPQAQGEFDALVHGITDLLGNAQAAPNDVDEQKSIAVLPFVNMSDDREQEYFSDGITEEIINALVAVKELLVIARTSAFQFKGTNLDIREIGKRLGVGHILEGSVRRAGNRIRVTAQLITVENGGHLWSERFDRELTDIFEVQDEISAEIVKALHGTLVDVVLPQTPVVNVEAYNAYLHGQYHFGRLELYNAIKAYQRAVQLDPTYADAYAGLALTYFMMEDLQVGVVAPGVVEAHAQRALELGPESAPLKEVHCRQLFFKQHEYQRAINEIAAAVLENPRDARLVVVLEDLCRHIRKPDLAFALSRYSVRMDPLSPSFSHFAALHAIDVEDYVEAAELIGQEERISGASNNHNQFWLAFVTGDLTTAKRCLDVGKDAWGANETMYVASQICYLKKSADAAALESLRASIDASPDDVPYLERAFLSAAFDDVDDALAEFSRAIDQGYIVTFWMINPFRETRRLFANLYEDPRFEQMLHRHGLDAVSLAAITVPPLPFLEYQP